MDYQRYVMHGLVADPPPAEIPPESWTNGTVNGLNRNGFMRRSNGNAIIGPYADNDAMLEFFYTKLLGAGVGALDSYFLILVSGFQYYCTGTTLSPPITSPFVAATLYNTSDVSGGVINNCIVYNYQDQPPLYWEPTVALGVAKRWPTLQWPFTQKAGVVRTWRNHVFAGNITKGVSGNPDMLMWSSSATPAGGIPTDWVATATNDARTIFLGEVPGPIVDMVPLRDQLFVFKESAFWALSFIGGAFVFSARKVTDAFGINGKNCAVDCGGFLVCLCNEDVMWTDGQSFRSIASQKVRDSIVAMTTIFSRKFCFVFYNQATKDCYVCLCKANDTICHVAWVWNADTELWSFVDLVESPASGTIGLTCAHYVPPPGNVPAGVVQSNAPSMVGAEIRALTGVTTFVDIQATPNWISGNPVTATLVRNALDGGAPDIVKYLNRVDLNIVNPVPATAVQISINGRMKESDAIAAPTFVTVSNVIYQQPCNVVGRFFDIQVRCAAPGFECHGLSLLLGDASVF